MSLDSRLGRWVAVLLFFALAGGAVERHGEEAGPIAHPLKVVAGTASHPGESRHFEAAAPHRGHLCLACLERLERAGVEVAHRAIGAVEPPLASSPEFAPDFSSLEPAPLGAGRAPPLAA